MSPKGTAVAADVSPELGSFIYNVLEAFYVSSATLKMSRCVNIKQL
jgi:hypothetical protein